MSKAEDDQLNHNVLRSESIHSPFNRLKKKTFWWFVRFKWGPEICEATSRLFFFMILSHGLLTEAFRDLWNQVNFVDSSHHDYNCLTTPSPTNSAVWLNNLLQWTEMTSSTLFRSAVNKFIWIASSQSGWASEKEMTNASHLLIF